MTVWTIPIVEGQTEQRSIERLLHRVWTELLGQHERLQVVEPFRGSRDALTHPDGKALADATIKSFLKLQSRAKNDHDARLYFDSAFRMP
jgi:hypothetical protein